MLTLRNSTTESRSRRNPQYSNKTQHNRLLKHIKTLTAEVLPTLKHVITNKYGVNVGTDPRIRNVALDGVEVSFTLRSL
jgi:hypothetical protein